MLYKEEPASVRFYIDLLYLQNYKELRWQIKAQILYEKELATVRFIIQICLSDIKELGCQIKAQMLSKEESFTVRFYYVFNLFVFIS